MQHPKAQKRAIHLPEVLGKVIHLQADQVVVEIPEFVHQVLPRTEDLHQADQKVVGDRAVPGHQGVRAAVQRVPAVVKSQDKSVD